MVPCVDCTTERARISEPSDRLSRSGRLGLNHSHHIDATGQNRTSQDPKVGDIDSDVTTGTSAKIFPQVSGIGGKSEQLGEICSSAGPKPSLLKAIERPVELCVTSASKSFWINVHENVRLHA